MVCSSLPLLTAKSKAVNWANTKSGKDFVLRLCLPPMVPQPYRSRNPQCYELCAFTTCIYIHLSCNNNSFSHFLTNSMYQCHTYSKFLLFFLSLPICKHHSCLNALSGQPFSYYYWVAATLIVREGDIAGIPWPWAGSICCHSHWSLYRTIAKIFLEKKIKSEEYKRWWIDFY